MKPIKFNSLDEQLMEIGKQYTVGINDGKEFRMVKYCGSKNFNGKPMMMFETKFNEKLSINPSFHSFTITDNNNIIGENDE